MRFKITALLAGVALALGVTASAAHAVMPHGNAVMPHGVTTVTQAVATQQNTAPSLMLAGVCPSGDGSASWGDGKVCTDSTYGARIHYRDSLTDGHCVKVMYYSDDISNWRQDGSTACTTGQWLTFGTSASKLCAPNARLYRGDMGAYFTMPSTLGCA